MPISLEIQDLERRLRALPARKQRAFAAGCAERVVTVHDFDGYADSEDLERAADLMWKVTLGGKVSPTTIRKARKGVTAAMPESAEDEPTYSATAFSAVAVLNGLDVIEERDPEAIVLVSRGEYDAYEALAGDAGREYEQDWQGRAVTLLEGIEETAIERDLFEPLGDPPKHLFPELAD